MKGPLQIGQEVCEALGLDAGKVRAITIRLRLNDFPSVEVEYINIVGDELVATLKRYELHDPDDGLAGAA